MCVVEDVGVDREFEMCGGGRGGGGGDDCVCEFGVGDLGEGW